ncbi:MAG: hypothetical protein IJ475_00150 [Bacilli bacterium]|nr:hypothetical protein [Bacilli bacterium]
MKKFKLGYFVFAFLLVLLSFTKANAEGARPITLGQTTQFINGVEYVGVSCEFSGDLDVFKFTSNIDDYYVTIEDLKDGQKSATASASCSYVNHYVRKGDSKEFVDSNGTLTFNFSVAADISTISTIEIYMDRQFINVVDMSGYLDQKASEGVETFTLSSEFNDVFEMGTNNEVACNNQSCLLKLKQNARVGETAGKIYYDQLTLDFIVHVSEYWMVQANPGYGTCEFEEGWEAVNDSNWYRMYTKNNSIVLPNCSPSDDTGNTYLAMEFVGWTYANDSKSDSEAGAGMYQSSGTCSVFFKDDADIKDGDIPGYSADRIRQMKQYVGTIRNGEVFAPSALSYDGSGNSAFYGCYKRTGVGISLDDVNIVNDYEYDIANWAAVNGIYYKNLNGEFVLPEVEVSALKRDNYVFAGWSYGQFVGDNPQTLIPSGTTVDGKNGVIYYPVLMRSQSQTSVSKSVYVGNKVSIIPPSNFTCEDFDNEYFSVTPANGECIIAGLKSTNGEYMDYLMHDGERVFTVKVSVVSVIGDEGIVEDPIEIGDGDILIGGGEETDPSIPSECNSYFVGKSMGTSSNAFTYNIRNYEYRGNTYNFTYSGSINTYYAASNCDDTEYLALCVDPGRSGPTSASGTRVKNGYVGIDYKFEQYVDPNSPNAQYAEFSKGVAYIIAKVGNVPFDEFKASSNRQKVAANIALRIINFYANLSVSPDTSIDAEGQQNYLKGYAAYDLIARQLQSYIEEGTVTIEVLKSLESSLSGFSWNYEYANVGDASNPSVLQLIADYLNYNANESVVNAMQEPTLEDLPKRENNYAFNVTIPEVARINGEGEGIGIQISSRIAPYFEIRTGEYQDENGNRIVVTKRIDSNSNEVYDYQFESALNPNEPNPVYQVVFELITSDGQIEFPAQGSRDFALFVNYTSSFSKQNAFLVTPTYHETSVQRMILFKPDGVTKWFALNLFNCDTLLSKLTDDSYKNTAYYQSLYNAGCCEFALSTNESYSEFYNLYCKKDCVASTFVPVCSFNESCELQAGNAAIDGVANDSNNCEATTSSSNNTYKIKEAMRLDGTIDYKCVVDVTAGVTYDDALDANSNMTDVAGNKIAIAAYDDNEYCRVTCKEDVIFNMPGFYNFIDKNAVKAGSLFQINNSIGLQTTTTCLTSYIDIEGYKDDVEYNVGKMVEAYNKLSDRSAAHSDLVISNVQKVWYTYEVEEIQCSTSDFASGSTTSGFCSIGGNYETDHTCTSITDHADCLTGTTYTTTDSCTSSDIEGDGFKSASSKGADRENCSVSGSYKKVKQTTHDEDAVGGKCYQYTVSMPSKNTKYQKWNTNGTAGAMTTHGDTNSYTTGFNTGSVNVCGSETTCYVSTTTLTDNGGCDTDNENRANSTHWYNDIIDNQIKFAGDSVTIRQSIINERANVLNYQTIIDGISTKFGKCQNFYILNTSDVEHAPKLEGVYGKTNVYDNGNKIGNPSNAGVSIDVKFDPKGTFGYDEKGYMDQIGNGNNIIIKNGSINMKSYAYGYYITDVNNTGVMENFAQYYGESANSVVSPVESGEKFNFDMEPSILIQSLCTVKDLSWNYTSGTEFNYDSTNNYCVKTDFYYYNINYMKKVLTSSADYDNNITWYRKNNGQIISAGIGLAGESALKSAMSRANYEYNSDSIYDWSIMGTKNVFPISLMTRRNMYQYFYKFAGLGNYFRAESYSSGRDGVGRIMGYTDSVVEDNARVCFYEVYESICICCGNSKADYLITDATKVDTHSHINSNGYSYIMSSKYMNASGRMGFNTSTVSLHSLNNASEDVLGANWKENNKFFYNGTDKYQVNDETKYYTTNKGSELADEIQEKGETVYSGTPEYSYTLTPDVMASIRSYNDGKTYGFASGTLYSVNNSDEQYAYLAHSDSLNSNSFKVTNDNQATQIKFSHYGSIFLRDYLKTYETVEYKNDLLTNKKMSSDCYVTKASDIYDNSSKYKECKWVDYVEEVNGSYYRLAFK